MAYLTANPTLDPGRAADSTPVEFKSDRQGILSIFDRVRTAAMGGKLFVANHGSVTGELTTPATQAVTKLRPSTWLRVPQGKTIYVIRHTVSIETSGNTTQGEIALALASNDVGDAGGSSTSATSIRNANPSKIASTPGTSGRHNATGDISTPSNYIELDRFSHILSAANLKFEFNANKNGLLIPIVGPATFLCYIGGNLVKFFAQTVFIEEDSNLAS